MQTNTHDLATATADNESRYCTGMSSEVRIWRPTGKQYVV